MNILFDFDCMGRLCNELCVLSYLINKYNGINFTLYFTNKRTDNFIKLLNYNNIKYTYNCKNVIFDYMCNQYDYHQIYTEHNEKLLQQYIKFPEYICEKYKDYSNKTIIHVRRGDYLNADNIKLYLTLTPEYIKRVCNKYNFINNIVIVSDDINWCKINLAFLPSDTIFSTGDTLEDLYLISIAKNIICSSSSFSFIGCLLNKNTNKLCIGHIPFWQRQTENYLKIYPNYFNIENYYDKKIVTIYYIATHSYKCFWDNFIETLENFMPSYKKHVILLTDGLEKWKDINNYHGITIEYHHIEHIEWPYITLYKFKYMLNYAPYPGTSYVCYFNSNVILKNTNLDDSWIVNDKINLTYHFCDMWSNTYSMKNPFDTNLYYTQAGAITIPIKYYEELCKWHSDRVDYYLKQHQMPKWHDETILNEWVANNSEKCVWYKYTNLCELLNKSHNKNFVNIKG